MKRNRYKNTNECYNHKLLRLKINIALHRKVHWNLNGDSSSKLVVVTVEHHKGIKPVICLLNTLKSQCSPLL